jgi:hypothetical protein
MLTSIEVRLTGASNNFEIFKFGALFNVREVPVRLASKLKTTAGRLRIYATSEAATNPADDGESMTDICAAIFANSTTINELLVQGGFSFANEEATIVVFYLRVDACNVVIHPADAQKESTTDVVAASSGMSSGVGTPSEASSKERKRTSSQVMAVLQHAASWVWPRDENGVPLPSKLLHFDTPPAQQTSTSLHPKSKPNWVDVHLLSVMKHFAKESNIPLIENHTALWSKVVRVVYQWRTDMINKNDHAKNQVRYELWQSSPYGKRWKSGIFSAPPRPLMSTASTNTTAASGIIHDAR